MSEGAVTPDTARMQQALQKYAEERDKRLRPDTVSQFVERDDFVRDCWVDASSPVPPISSLFPTGSTKILILGAGFSALCAAVRLVEAGFDAHDVRLVDLAGGFGGTWYWNRYPGLMCDLESYCYLPLLEETGYMPKHKYSYGPEIRAYADLVARKWKLDDKACFQTRITSMDWDEPSKRWGVGLRQERTGRAHEEKHVSAQYVYMASGVLNTPHLPKLPGLDDFKGRSFHTSRWNYSVTGGSPAAHPALDKLHDKTVGYIGTGATAIQALPELAKWAKHLYVFQRTPSAVAARGQRETDPEWFKHQVAGQAGWYDNRNENMLLQLYDKVEKPADLVDDEWSRCHSYSCIIGSPTKVTMENVGEHIGMLHAMDLPRQDRIRARVDEIVHDRDTAAKLKAWYPSWCKRPCFHDDYLAIFNKPNVTLVDTDGKGVDALTPSGVMFGGKEYPVDILIFGTGYRTPSSGSGASRANLVIRGRDGRAYEDKFRGQDWGTLHGCVTNGFPNLFFPGPSQAAVSASYLFSTDKMAQHVSYIIAQAEKKAAGKTVTIEPSVEAEQAWSMEVMARAITMAGMAGCTPSYFNAQGALDAPKSQEEMIKAAKSAPWGDGMMDFLDRVQAWRAKGDMEGLVVAY